MRLVHWLSFALSAPFSGYVSDYHSIQSWTFVCAVISGLGMVASGLVHDLNGMIWTYGVLCGEGFMLILLQFHAAI